MTADEQGPALARALRELRESAWPDTSLTQAQLATAFSISPATISSWESTVNPKPPTRKRLHDYARFFATRHSLDGHPHLVAERDLGPEEKKRYAELQKRLLDLLARESDEPKIRSTLHFADGPVTIICPETPANERGPLAAADHPNFNFLERYADLDALFELHGHLRATNPDLDVVRRLPAAIRPDDLSTHVIVLGGVGWNVVMERIQAEIDQLPIRQIDDPGIPDGDIFTVRTGKETHRFLPVWTDRPGTGSVLFEDVAMIVRLPNPFKVSRTLTIATGVYSRGVMGAVRCLTDARVRAANERYLAGRFPGGRFALLLRVHIVANEVISPDLQNPAVRLFEWPSANGEAT